MVNEQSRNISEETGESFRELNVFERAFLFLKQQDLLENAGIKAQLRVVRADPAAGKE